MAHSCFTEQLHTEPCPFCGSTDNVFVGHGTTRHCTDCVMSWGEGEIIEPVEFARSELDKKLSDLPDDLKKRIRQTARNLMAASGAEERLKRLRAISDEEWEQAINATA